MEKMLAGISTRRSPTALAAVRQEVREDSKCTSKSVVSRRFVRLIEPALTDLLPADLTEGNRVAPMIDRVHFAYRLFIVALGIDVDGAVH